MLGCGEVAETKSGPGLTGAANSRLVAVADRNPGRAESFARRHGVARWHDDAEAIIAAPDIDAVYVATMTESHRDFVLRCAAAGKPVLTEKPMAMDYAGALEMIAACRRAGVPLWVAYYRRALPRFLKVRDLVRDGAIGPVRMVITRHFQRIPTPEAMRGPFWGWRLDPARSGGGIFFEAVGHTLDILDFILGPIASARSFADNQAGVYPPEDAVTATFRYACGAWAAGYGVSLPIAATNATKSSAPPAASAFRRSRRLAPGRAATAADPADPRRVGRGIPDCRPALCAPAADPDHRRRDEREGSLPQHRRIGGPHRAGDRRLPCRIQYGARRQTPDCIAPRPLTRRRP